jgi:hypothetical protein
MTNAMRVLLDTPPSFLGRFRWARHFGAKWWPALVCALRGSHDWNVICCYQDNSVRPSAPTSCLMCGARYTEEWDAAKLERDRAIAAESKGEP